MGKTCRRLLMQNNISMDDVRKQYEDRIRWEEFLKFKATEATLRKYLADHRDFFSDTQVRASHIMIKVEPNASAADKEKAKQKLAEHQERDRRRNSHLRGRGQQVFRRPCQ